MSKTEHPWPIQCRFYPRDKEAFLLLDEHLGLASYAETVRAAIRNYIRDLISDGQIDTDHAHLAEEPESVGVRRYADKRSPE